MNTNSVYLHDIRLRDETGPGALSESETGPEHAHKLLNRAKKITPKLRAGHEEIPDATSGGFSETD